VSIATRTGDDGTTGLLYGQRVPKDHPQVEAVGACDELNAALGAAKALVADPETRTLLADAQRNLVALMGEVVCAEVDAPRYSQSDFAKVEERDLGRLDEAVKALEASGLKFEGWATPGANPAAAALDLARVAARRAERRLVGLPRQGRGVRPVLIQFLNRLSDVLWLLARRAEGQAG